MKHTLITIFAIFFICSPAMAQIIDAKKLSYDELHQLISAASKQDKYPTLTLKEIVNTIGQYDREEEDPEWNGMQVYLWDLANDRSIKAVTSNSTAYYVFLLKGNDKESKKLIWK